MDSRTLFAVVASLAAVAPLARTAQAQCTDPIRLSIQGASASDQAGRALAMTSSVTGPRLIVGVAQDEHTAAQNSGSASIFVRSNGVWTTQARLFPSDPVTNGRFGASVALTDQYAVVGAPGAGGGGGMYFFQRSGSDWNQVTRFAPASVPAGRDLGWSVAISGDIAVIGAPGDDRSGFGTPTPNTGMVYFARRLANGQWEVTAAMSDHGGLGAHPPDQRLGHAVAMSGDYMFLGAPFGRASARPLGSGYVSVHRLAANGFPTFHARLVPAQGAGGDNAGYSLAADSTTVAVGAPGRDIPGLPGGTRTDSGCVYLYQLNQEGQWVEDGMVRASDPESGGRFGSSVAVRGARLVVGAEGSKKVYLFRRVGPGQWMQEAVMTDPEQPAQGLFGTAVAFDGTYVAAGDAGDDLGGWQTDAGAVYMFTGPGFGQSDVCATAIPIGSGQYGGCTRFASREALATCGGILQGPDAWHAFTPACSGTAMVHTAGSSFDTVLSVHHSCPTPGGSSHTLACNDNAGGALGNASMVTFEYEAGVTCFIRVSGANNESGSYVLELDEGPVPANDSCEDVQVITDGVHTFANCRATGLLPAVNGCSAPSIFIRSDVWFLYTAPRTGTATVDLCASGFDTAAAAYAGPVCPAQAGTAIACSNGDAACPGGGAGQSRLVFAVTEGAHYIIRVGSAGMGRGTVVMDLRTNGGPAQCPADWNQDGAVNSGDITAFLTDWLASVQGGTLVADFSGDGLVNSADITAFLTAWLDAVQNGC